MDYFSILIYIKRLAVRVVMVMVTITTTTNDARARFVTDPVGEDVFRATVRA